MLSPKLAAFSFLSPKSVSPGCVMNKPGKYGAGVQFWLVAKRAEPSGFPGVTGVQAQDCLGLEENRLMPLVGAVRD